MLSRCLNAMHSPSTRLGRTTLGLDALRLIESERRPVPQFTSPNVTAVEQHHVCRTLGKLHGSEACTGLGNLTTDSGGQP